MSVDTKEFLTKQRKRATGSVLGFIERAPWYERLTVADKAEVREKVLSAMGAYHDSVLDVISTLDGAGGIHNDRALELLQQLADHVVPPRRERPLTAAPDGR